jgi:type IV secretory pathway VirB3-like protein
MLYSGNLSFIEYEIMILLFYLPQGIMFVVILVAPHVSKKSIIGRDNQAFSLQTVWFPMVAACYAQNA